MTSIEVVSSIFARKQNEQILEYVAICHTQNMHIRFSATTIEEAIEMQKQIFEKQKEK